MDRSELNDDAQLRKQLSDASLGLYKLAKSERKKVDLEDKDFVEYLCDLELLSSWAAGLLLSSNFEQRFQNQVMCGELNIFLGMLPAISARTIEISEKFPATASYASSVTLQMYYIKSAMDSL